MALNKSSNICFFNTVRSWGGGEKWHFDMAETLFREGFKVHFVAHKNSQLSKKLSETSIPAATIKISNLSFLNPLKILKLKQYFKNNRIELVVMNFSADLKSAGIAARLAGVKQIVYRRGSAIPIKNKLLNRFLFHRVITGIIANSEATKKTINEKNPDMFPDEKIKVIYNGLKINEYNANDKVPYQRQNNEIILGHAGRMVYQKGHEYLIEIAQILKSENINFKILLAGVGPLEEEIKNRVSAAGLNDSFVFLGFVKNIHQFMLNIDVFVLPSRWEGFGFVIAEAMAASKPVVAFDISSNPELVKHGENGFLAEPFNCKEFAGYLMTLLKNNSLLKRFGESGYQKVIGNFTFEKTVSAFKEMFFNDLQ